MAETRKQQHAVLDETDHTHTNAKPMRTIYFIASRSADATDLALNHTHAEGVCINVRIDINTAPFTLLLMLTRNDSGALCIISHN